MLADITTNLLGYLNLHATHIVDVVSTTTRYDGWTLADVDYDQPYWYIRKTTQTDDTTQIEQWAFKGNSLGKWAERAIIFPPLPLPPFSNKYSVNFDGINDYVDCGQQGGGLFSGFVPCSVCMWVRPAPYTQYPFLISKYDGAYQGFGIYLSVDNNCTHVIFRQTVGNEILVHGTLITSNGVAWTHIAMTYDGSGTAAGIKLYYNGVLQAMTTVTDALVSAVSKPTSPIRIGSTALGGTMYQGNIDEVITYSIELNPAQVSDIYNTGNVIDVGTLSTYADCVSYYHMGDLDTFPVLNDTKGTNHGVMTNMEASQIQEVTP